jgi:hypothetical protein
VGRGRHIRLGPAFATLEQGELTVEPPLGLQCRPPERIHSSVGLVA